MAKTEILVVEDESLVAEDVRVSLDNLGYSVRGMASSGEEAIKKAGELHPDLVLMDIVLGGEMDGIEAAEKIRTRFNIPILYLTAYADEKTLERAKVTQPFGYILKPFDDRQLHSNIEMALYKYKIERELTESEEKYRTLFEGAPDGVEVLDRQGNIVDCNRAEELLLGYSRDEIIGKHVTAFLQEGSRDLFRQSFSVVKEVGYSDCECQLLRKDGSTISAWRKNRALYDEKRELVGVVVHVLTQQIWDISRKQQRELIQAYVKQNPNASLEQIGNFLGVRKQRAQMVLKMLGIATQRQQARRSADTLVSRGTRKHQYSPQALTVTEAKVLRHIARGDSNKQVALALNVSPRTIRNHITRILAKLNADTRTRAVVLAMQQGLISLDEIGPANTAPE
jgi:PAS domain S-box-containing protein